MQDGGDFFFAKERGPGRMAGTALEEEHNLLELFFLGRRLPDADAVLDGLVLGGADAFHFKDLFDRGEGVRLAVLHDLGRRGGTDAGEGCQFLNGCGVDVDEVGGKGRRTEQETEEQHTDHDMEQFLHLQEPPFGFPAHLACFHIFIQY